VSQWIPGLIEELTNHEGDVEAVSGKLVEEARKKLEIRANMSEIKDDLLLYSGNPIIVQKPSSPPIGEHSEQGEISSFQLVRCRNRSFSSPAGKGHHIFGGIPPLASIFHSSSNTCSLRGQKQSIGLIPLSGHRIDDIAAEWKQNSNQSKSGPVQEVEGN